MNEKFPSGTPKSFADELEATTRRNERETAKRYENIEAANPRMFIRTSVEGKIPPSPFILPPSTFSITPEVITDLVTDDSYTEHELGENRLRQRLSKLLENTSALGEYEVACVMREEGDTKRIDRMIANLDPDEPWEAGGIEHLLLLRRLQPELFEMPEGTNGPVVALGSITKQTSNVPRLKLLNEKICYDNHPRHAGFNNNCRFVVVRKKR